MTVLEQWTRNNHTVKQRLPYYELASRRHVEVKVIKNWQRRTLAVYEHYKQLLRQDWSRLPLQIKSSAALVCGFVISPFTCSFHVIFFLISWFNNRQEMKILVWRSLFGFWFSWLWHSILLADTDVSAEYSVYIFRFGACSFRNRLDDVSMLKGRWA